MDPSSNPSSPLSSCPTAPPRVGVALGQLLAWVGLAVVNAVFIARLKSQGPASVRVLHHLFDAGQLLAAGALSFAVVRAWERLVPPRRAWAYGALGVASAALAWAFLRTDLANFAERVGHARANIVLTILTLGAGVMIPAAAFTGRRIALPAMRWAGIGTALLGAVANNVVLHNDYRGVHLFISIAAAVHAGSCLVGAPLPAALARVTSSRALALASQGVLALAALAALVVSPRSRVRAEIFRLDGAVVAPIVARVGLLAGRSAVNVSPEAAPWFRDRSGAPPVAPTGPRMMPPNGIVLLITVDSMRASLFSDPKTRAKLPRLSQLEDQSVDFTMARSPGSRTVVTWGSVYMGKYHSGIQWQGVNIAKDPSVRFPMLLTEAGVPSINFVSCTQLGRDNLKAGFTDEVYVPPRKGQSYATSTEVMPRVIEHLRAHHTGPLFVFAHLMDPHFPYDSASEPVPTSTVFWPR